MFREEKNVAVFVFNCVCFVLYLGLDKLSVYKVENLKAKKVSTLCALVENLRYAIY